MNKVEKLKEILPDIPQAHGDLKKEGATSQCGPCPKCGGVDRFVFKTDSNRFWCRHCYPEDKPGDKIGFHMWIEGLDCRLKNIHTQMQKVSVCAGIVGLKILKKLSDNAARTGFHGQSKISRRCLILCRKLSNRSQFLSSRVKKIVIPWRG